METSEIPVIDLQGESLSAEQREFLHELKDTVDQLNSSGLKGRWFMIGGLAKDAYTKNSGFGIGTAEHPRDMDILVTDGDFIGFERARTKIHSKIIVGGFLNRFIHAGKENSFLHFGPIKKQVPPEVFQIKEVDLFGVKFPTVAPETLFHIYCLRGTMRPKDFLSALQIGRYMKKNSTPGLPEEKYEEFHEFSRRSKERSIHPQVVMTELSKWYSTTKMSRVLPLNGPVLRSIVLHIWDAAGLIGK